MKTSRIFNPIIGTLLTFAIAIGGLMLFKGPNFVIAKYYYLKGHHKQNTQDLQAAIKIYSKVMEVDSTFVAAYISRGSAYVDLKKYDLALADYNRAEKLTPDDAHIYAYRGRAYYDSDQYENALNDYNKALILDETFGYAYYNRGLLKYVVNKDFEGACIDLLNAAELGFDEAQDLIDKGYCK